MNDSKTVRHTHVKQQTGGQMPFLLLLFLSFLYFALYSFLIRVDKTWRLTGNSDNGTVNETLTEYILISLRMVFSRRLHSRIKRNELPVVKRTLNTSIDLTTETDITRRHNEYSVWLLRVTRISYLLYSYSSGVNVSVTRWYIETFEQTETAEHRGLTLYSAVSVRMDMPPWRWTYPGHIPVIFRTWDPLRYRRAGGDIPIKRFQL